MSGTIQFDPSDKSRATVNVEIAVESVNTGIRKRDEHLLSGDFFDQGKYPTIKFTSRSVEFTANNRCRVSGDLTLHGTTRPVVFEGEYAGPRKNPYGCEMSVGLSGATTVSREDFGIMWERADGRGGLVAGKEVQIFLDVEADLSE
jgi:polyisoprenoid-binding protein YceI